MIQPSLILALIFLTVAALLILVLFVYLRAAAEDRPMAELRETHDPSDCVRCRFIADITADQVEDLLR